MPSRRFIVWFLVVIAVFVFANVPRDGGTLNSFLVWAGFPWTFAFWDGGRLKTFSATALAADVALALSCASIVAYVCSLSRKRTTLRANPPNKPV